MIQIEVKRICSHCKYLGCQTGGLKTNENHILCCHISNEQGGRKGCWEFFYLDFLRLIY